MVLFVKCSSVIFLQNICVQPACRLSEKLINGQCHRVINGHGGFCFDFRFTAIFQSTNIDIQTLASQHGLIHEILSHANLNLPYKKLIERTQLMEVKSISIVDGGKLNVDLQAAVSIDDLVSMDIVYTEVVAGLAQHSLNANWSGVPYRTILTPTAYQPMFTDELEMAIFQDSPILQFECSMMYAMAEIQACDGVKIQEFYQKEGNVMQASSNTRA